ncbi:hypothetical protein F0562_031510 [Nyssa sinensis]|uniref:Uncharacterized protein n=1 Tax=Nyssa sinensis TaxID=561372 RepID=A0A5J5ASQ5_9ASTE|nr:hypothetical protein F0562_031510 [Nyssa sinensis]
MANPSRTRKRVLAIRRAPDGSAFEKCCYCGVSVAIAIANMHECESKRDVKRIKGECGNQNVKKQSFQDQPRSAFRFFMENVVNTCKDGNWIDVDREGVETWRNMSKEERLPYILQAEKVNSAYEKGLLQEIENMSWVNDEADSAEVGKYDENYVGYESDEDFVISDGFWSESFESFNSDEWEMVRPWIVDKSH